MANITQFDTPIGLVPNPDDRAASTAREAGTAKNIYAREAGQALGGAISKVGSQVGAEIDRHNTMAWIGHGAATYASLLGDLTQQWNKLASESDPNDTSIRQGFKEQALEPSLEKFQRAFDDAPVQAQEWALKRADEMRDHFVKTTAADMGIRAGLAVQKNIGDMERGYSVNVMNDPTSLGHVANSIKTDVRAMVESNPNIRPSDVARIWGEIVPKVTQRVAQAAFDGLAQRDPKEALRQLDHGDFNAYADGVTQAQWRKYAETQQKIQDADAKRDALQAKQQFKDNSADKAQEYYGKMYDVNTGRILPTNPKLNQQIFQDPALTIQDKTALIRWNHTQYEAQLREDKQKAEGPPSVSDGKVLADLRDRVGSAVNPTTLQQVVDATAAGLITTKDSHDLRWRVGQSDAAWQAIQRPFQQQFRQAARLALNSQNSILKYLTPQEQSDRLNQVEADAQQILRDAYARREDMRPYLDQNSPKWALKEALSQISSTPQAAVAQQAAAVRSAAERLPETGEVREGYRYKGPNNDRAAANKASNWEKVEPSKADQIPR